MFLWPLLLGLALSSPTSIHSSTLNFERSTTVTGSISYGKGDVLVIEVTSSSVHTLAITLAVSQGNADLGVVAEVKGIQVIWTAETEGGEYLEILQSDRKLSDGLGLKRLFAVVVGGVSREMARYTLTVTAQGASNWKAVDSEESLKAHIAVCRKDALFAIREYDGDASEYVKAMDRGSSWYGVVGGVLLLGLGACVWRKWGGKQGENEEISYRFS